MNRQSWGAYREKPPFARDPERADTSWTSCRGYYGLKHPPQAGNPEGLACISHRSSPSGGVFLRISAPQPATSSAESNHFSPRRITRYASVAKGTSVIASRSTLRLSTGSERCERRGNLTSPTMTGEGHLHDPPSKGYEKPGLIHQWSWRAGWTEIIPQR